MQLNITCKIKLPPTFKDDGTEVTHLPVLLKNPIFTFHKDDKFNLIYAQTKNLPLYIILYSGSDYFIAKNYDNSVLVQDLINILGSNPCESLQDLIDTKHNIY